MRQGSAERGKKVDWNVYMKILFEGSNFLIRKKSENYKTMISVDVEDRNSHDHAWTPLCNLNAASGISGALWKQVGLFCSKIKFLSWYQCITIMLMHISQLLRLFRSSREKELHIYRLSKKKPGQIAVVRHNCNLSRFFWFRCYKVRGKKGILYPNRLIRWSI